jgi:L-alanine-DL-glutamate epimerase-like enolase superfamily enzyme
MTIMVDVQYAFDSVERALAAIAMWDGLDVFFLETPLWTDDVDGYAELSSLSPVRIAAGEWLSTRHDFEVLIDQGGVEVAQPDIGRVGGFTEARRVCEFAGRRGRLIVPHARTTGLFVAAATQLAMVTPMTAEDACMTPE